MNNKMFSLDDYIYTQKIIKFTPPFFIIFANYNARYNFILNNILLLHQYTSRHHYTKFDTLICHDIKHVYHL